MGNSHQAWQLLSVIKENPKHKYQVLAENLLVKLDSKWRLGK